MKLPKQFFVAGTDTDVGKTHVSVELIKMMVERGEKVGVMKPIAAGGYYRKGQLVNQDAIALMEASGSGQSYQEVNPYLFEEPISPHIAACRSKVEIDLDRLVKEFQKIRDRFDRVLVEGAGGWITPLSNSISMADLAGKMDIPVVLVVGMKLGCLNHAQLTQKAIKQSGLELAGWVANSPDPHMLYLQENIEYLVEHLDCPLLAHISYKKL